MIIPLAIIATLVGSGRFEGPLTFQSWESKTTQEKPVFNSIKWFPGKKKDVWMMNQSHDGPAAPHEKWDRLAS